MNTDGSNVVRLTSNGDDEQWPCFTKDGQQIVFSHNPGAELYAVGIDGSNYHRISDGDCLHADTGPLAFVVTPFAFSTPRGAVLGGGLSSLFASDDDFLYIRPGPVFSNTESPEQLVLQGVSPYPQVTGMAFQSETAVSAPGIQQVVELYDFANGAWVLLDSRVCSQSDTPLSLTAPGDVSRFVEPVTNNLKARIRWKANGAVFLWPWVSRTDYVAWTVTS